jgi:transposase
MIENHQKVCYKLWQKETKRRENMSLRNKSVDMPKKRITYNKAKNGVIYVYYTTRAYRNKKGKPTNDKVAIGKKDIATGKLIPNTRYYEIFKNIEPIDPIKTELKSIKNYGTTATLMNISKQTGLLDILKKYFPSEWNKILASAFYVLCQGNVMMYIEDWFDETNVNFSEKMDDSDCSKLFESITEEDRSRFFAEWIKYRSEKEYIAYDVSSISTYSDNIDIAEWGYNRDGESLPQINLGMFYGVSSRMPVYYDLYNGSIPDKVYLEFIMTKAKYFGINNVCFVIDRGFITEDNFLYMHNNRFLFVTALPKQRLDALKLIDENKSSIRKIGNWISEYKVYGVSVSVKMYGLNFNAHIYYDPEKQIFDEKELYSRIEKLQEELEKMSHTKRATKKYSDYFVIGEDSKNILTFELNADKVDQSLGRSGLFILLTNKLELKSNEVLKIYRDRDVIEKNFEQFKNRLDFKRMRTHWKKTTEGKMFVGFIALILRSYMLGVIKNDPQTKHLTLEKVLLELRKIRLVTLNDQNTILTPLTKLQKTILSVLKTSLQILTN